MPAKRGEPGPLTKRAAVILRMRLAELRWTQEHLASRSGVSQSHLSQILAGNRHIYIDQLDRMCEAMELDLSDVIGAAESARDALMDDLGEQIPSRERPAIRTAVSESDAG